MFVNVNAKHQNITTNLDSH